MGDMPGMSDKAGAESGKQQTASATGTVAAVNASQHKVTFDHEPIPAINWPAMHMEFPQPPRSISRRSSRARRSSFTLSGSKGSYTVQAITPAP